MKDIKKIVGRAIAKERVNNDWTQEKLAEMFGCHRTYIGKIESGQIDLRITKVEKFANILEVPIESLLQKPIKKNND